MWPNALLLAILSLATLPFLTTSQTQPPPGGNEGRDAVVEDRDTVVEDRDAVVVGRDESRVLVLQRSGKPTATSHARLVSVFPSLASFTACYWLRLVRFREESTLMSYAVSDSRDNELRMDHRVGQYKVSVQSRWAEVTLTTPFRFWSHFCFTFNQDESVWSVYMDGDMKASGTLTPTPSTLEPGGAFIIGQEQDSMGGGFQRDQSFSGEITHLNFWSSVLSNNTINRVARCKDRQEGDALGWSQQVWDIKGEVEWQVRKTVDVCNRRSRQVTFFPDRFSLQEGRHLCKVVGGRMQVPLNTLENTQLYDVSVGRAKHCSGGQGSSFMWLGATDQRKERQWEYLDTGEAITWESTWRGSGPNGGKAENCLVMLTGSFPARWSDIACLDSYEFCIPCEFTSLSTLYLKGPALCPNSPFNRKYVLGPEEGGRPTLQGFYHSDIYWDTDNHTWTLHSHKVPGATVTWKPPEEGMYPFGTRIWKLAGKVCRLAPGTPVKLTLSVCSEGQFTCLDGSCIPLIRRCDLRIDCQDQSDEVDCTLVQLSHGYSNTIPPPSATLGKPLRVIFYINIISFPSIVTQDLLFRTTVALSLRWKDIRLSYLNLKDDTTLNLLNGVTVDSVWTPRVFFSNARGNVFTNLEQGSRVEVVRGGQPTPAPPHLTHEVNIFSGRQSSLEMSQLYTLTYNCDFDLAMFPFDAQTCGLDFTLVSAAGTYMELIPGASNYSGNKLLIEYTIGRVNMETTTDGQFSRLRVYVRFLRRFQFYLLTLYIPTTLLMLIAYATFFFNPDDFNSRIVVALTALLVLSSLFTQTSNSLPKTSYFKLVDIWLFFSIVMIFLVTMMQTLIDFVPQDTNIFSRCRRFVTTTTSSKTTLVQELSKGGEARTMYPSEVLVGEEKGKNNNNNKKRSNGGVNMGMMKAGRALVPLIFCVFNMAYWGSALSHLAKIDG
ncbi:hypothetical protein Pcinc_027213 [Petrolisthes cinctipes]|uniref:Uncharacterized protein n=1 Tax=Petrolisthes cinctipes TaxID=88211 RepID=A0AAE1F5L7_PETCI|nr:hypothetical protein Pcinc_027213 [Petrolisthes cinctipes]